MARVPAEVDCVHSVYKIFLEARALLGTFSYSWFAQTTQRSERQNLYVVLTHLGAVSTLGFCTPAEYVKVCAAASRLDNLQNPLSASALKRFAAQICAKPADSVPKLTLQNASRFDGRLTLHRASQLGRLDVVWALARLGSHVNEFDVYGNTALHCAAAGNHLSICRFLLHAGANIEAKFDGHNARSGWTALHFAAYEGAYDVAKLLLEEGADVNAMDLCERTPFSCARDRGCRKVVLRLLHDWGAVDSERMARSITEFPLSGNGDEAMIWDCD